MRCRHLSSWMHRMNFPLRGCDRLRIMKKLWRAYAPGLHTLVKRANRSLGYVTTTDRMNRGLLCRAHGARSFRAASGCAWASARRSYSRRMSTAHLQERILRIGCVTSEPAVCCWSVSIPICAFRPQLAKHSCVVSMSPLILTARERVTLSTNCLDIRARRKCVGRRCSSS